MAYLVKITSRAKRDLDRLYREIDVENSDAALEWYRGLKDSVLSLERLPRRCLATPENSQLRNLLYGDKPHVYRVISRVREQRRLVEVLHIRHGARLQFKNVKLDSKR
jgi:plasmid stabilization system protein ParE